MSGIPFNINDMSIKSLSLQLGTIPKFAWWQNITTPNNKFKSKHNTLHPVLQGVTKPCVYLCS